MLQKKDRPIKNTLEVFKRLEIENNLLSKKQKNFLESKGYLIIKPTNFMKKNLKKLNLAAKKLIEKEGKDITIFCAGAMVHQSLEAAKTLETRNVSSKVVNMHTIKPIDNASINEACNFSKLIVSVEEHNVIGGLGSAIAENLAKNNKSPKLLTIGIDDHYSKGGSYKFLQEKHGLTSNQIVSNILENLR